MPGGLNNMERVGTLYFFYGKMGAGKSTKSKQLAIEKHAVLLSEDEWLSSLYPNQITSFCLCKIGKEGHYLSFSYL